MVPAESAGAGAGREAQVVGAVPTGLLVGGGWREAEGGTTFPVLDPSTGQTLVEVANATPADGMAALESAAATQDSWAATAPRERGEVLRRAFDLMHDRLDDLALLMTCLLYTSPSPRDHG